MPTKRRQRTHNRIAEFDDATKLHLESGDCLLAGPGGGCGCGLRGPDGSEREDLARAARRHFGISEKADAD